MKIEDYYGATTDYTKVLEINLNHKDYFKNRGLAKADIGDFQGACLDGKNKFLWVLLNLLKKLD